MAKKHGKKIRFHPSDIALGAAYVYSLGLTYYLHAFEVLDWERAGLYGALALFAVHCCFRDNIILSLFRELPRMPFLRDPELTAAKKLRAGAFIGAIMLLVVFAYGGLLFMIGLAGVETINAVGDASTPQMHRALVSDKHVHSGTRLGVTYTARVLSWREGHQTENVGITADEEVRLTPGQTYLLVATRAGNLGFEWVSTQLISP